MKKRYNDWGNMYYKDLVEINNLKNIKFSKMATRDERILLIIHRYINYCKI